ncbi:MAG: hypothetical protein AABX37_04530 [Nanoarchaeota archaeon]
MKDYVGSAKQAVEDQQREIRQREEQQRVAGEREEARKREIDSFRFPSELISTVMPHYNKCCRVMDESGMYNSGLNMSGSSPRQEEEVHLVDSKGKEFHCSPQFACNEVRRDFWVEVVGHKELTQFNKVYPDSSAYIQRYYTFKDQFKYVYSVTFPQRVLELLVEYSTQSYESQPPHFEDDVVYTERYIIDIGLSYRRPSLHTPEEVKMLFNALVADSQMCLKRPAISFFDADSVRSKVLQKNGFSLVSSEDKRRAPRKGLGKLLWGE